MSRTARLMAHVWTKSWSCLRRLASNGPTVGQCSRGSCTSSSMRHINVWNPHWNRGRLWSYMKLVSHMTKSYLIVNKPLVMYGLATFLWEKERISEQEVQKCLRYYEDRVVATSAYVPPGPTTTAVPVAVEQEKNAPSSSSSQISFFSWFSWQTEKKPKKAPVEEKELRRREMVAKLTAHYTERSEKKLSELPLVGMNSKVPIQYKIGSLVVKKTKEGVVSLLKQAGALTKIAVINSLASESTPVSLSCCKNIPDVACMEVELHHHPRLIGDWMPVPMDTESTNYPLVGLHTHQSKVIDALISFAERPSVQKSLSSFMHSLEQFLSMDDMAPSNSLSQEANCLSHTFLQNTQQTVDNMLQEEPSNKQHHTTPPLNTVSKQCPSRSNVEYLSDWEMFVDEPTYMVFRKQYADTGLYQFKVIGRYDDIAAQDFLEVQIDEELRMSWDHSVARLKTVDYDQNSDCGLVHWVMKYPFPMTSREYVYVYKRWTSPEKNAIVVVNRSIEDPSLPELSSPVRVKNYYSEMVIKAHTHIDQPGFNYELTYFDDPQVQIPSACVKWVTTSALPDFLRRVREAALTRRASQQQKKGLST